MKRFNFEIKGLLEEEAMEFKHLADSYDFDYDLHEYESDE